MACLRWLQRWWFQLKPWWFQLISMLASVGLVVVMAVVLGDSDGKRVTGDRETLNAKVSALSTANGVFLLLVIGACLSQQNWILFSDKKRRLYDFQAISDASRGLQGSLLLLIRWSLGWCLQRCLVGPRGVRGGVMVKIGAIATCLAVALDPFAQKIIAFEETWNRSSGGAHIPYASRYSRGIRLAGLSGVDVNDNGRVDLSGPGVYANADFEMQAAVSFGFSADADSIQQQAPFFCPGAQCDFDPLESLSVCSKCSNVTDHLTTDTLSNGGLYNDLQFDQSSAQVGPNSTEYSLPNGLFLNNIDDLHGPSRSMVYMTMSGTTDPNMTVTMSGIDTLIWAQTFIKVATEPDPNSNDRWPSFGVRASECALYYCVRRYEDIRYNNSRISFTSERRKDAERDPGSWASLTSHLQASDGISDKVLSSLAYHPQDSFIRRSDLRLRSADGTGEWNVSDSAVHGISYYMQTFFAACLGRENRANCTQALEDWVIPNGFYLSGFSEDGRQSEDYRPSTAKALWETGDVGQIFENVAASMSNALRRGGDSGVRGNGTVLSPSTVYRVVWPWMTLHCVQVVTVLVILASTIISTQRRSDTIDVWKSSELAVFAMGATLGSTLEGLHTKEELEKLAKSTEVGLFATCKETGRNPLVKRLRDVPASPSLDRVSATRSLSPDHHDLA